MQPINMMIYYWDKKLTKKNIKCPGSWYNNNLKNINLMFLAEMMHFLQDMFQITTIAPISVIYHYHINGLHLFWNTLYIYAYWIYYF